MTARRRTVLAAAAVLLLPGCTSFADTVTAQANQADPDLSNEIERAVGD